MNFFKDKLLPWLKQYWLMAVLGLIALAALPTAWFFSSSMNKTFVEEFQQSVTKDYDSVTKAKNTYELVGVSGDKLLTHPHEFNSELTQWYGERWKEIQSKTGVVWDEGLKFNKGTHALLREGVFPEPPALERDVKTRELVRAVIEFHKKILEDSRAGLPPEPSQIAAQLTEFRAAAVAKIQAEMGRGPDKAEAEKIGKDMLDQRLGRYRARANELSVYAFPGVFLGIPKEVSMTTTTSLVEAWELQEKAWVHADIMRAIKTANSESSIPSAVVKRVYSMQVAPAGYDPAQPTPAPFDAGDDKAPLNFQASVTGRMSGPGTRNKWFDIRQVGLDVVVSGQRVPTLIDALAATNFITVLDVALLPVDVQAEARQGFYYGDEHVVRARLTLETVWLREWRKDWMPLDVKKALGMDDSVQADAAAAAPSGGSGRRNPPPAGGGGGGAAGSGGKRGARDD
jgi:hypothetical protein